MSYALLEKVLKEWIVLLLWEVFSELVKKQKICEDEVYCKP